MTMGIEQWRQHRRVIEAQSKEIIRLQAELAAIAMHAHQTVEKGPNGRPIDALIRIARQARVALDKSPVKPPPQQGAPK